MFSYHFNDNMKLLGCLLAFCGHRRIAPNSGSGGEQDTEGPRPFFCPCLPQELGAGGRLGAGVGGVPMMNYHPIQYTAFHSNMI